MIKCNRCFKTLIGNEYQTHWETCPKQKTKKKKQPFKVISKSKPKPVVTGENKVKSLVKEVLKLKRKLKAQTKEAKKIKPSPPHKLPHPVYDDPRWKHLRYKTLRNYGFKCQACNRSGVELHVDHIKPHSKYSELAFDENNLQVLCADCNLGKSNIYTDDLRSK